jgi:hypothetical protein
MNVPWFCLGVLAGTVGSSLLWALYIAYFAEGAKNLGGRIKLWLRAKLKLPWW